MATYVRQSSFSDGDTITAALFNNEFNQLVNAFNVATGHTHDGSTAGDGGPISNLFSNALVFGTNTDNDVVITFNAASNDGVLSWMEDEDYFQFSDDLLIATSEKIQFRDTAIYINSSTDGQLDIVADTEVQIAATTIDMNGNADISGNLGVGGNLTVTGTTTFNGGTITMGDAATDNVVFGADVDSHIIPDDDDTYDLGSSTQEWRNLYIDGTANIDSLVADTADINGGTIDAANITVGSGKTLDVSAGTLTLADNQISGDKVEGGTINATTINTLTYGSITDGTITVTAFVDEDDMSSNSATLIPTQQSVKAYVDAQDTAQDLDLVSDSGTIAIDLDGETLTVTGGEGIDTSASSNTLTITGEDATTSNKGIASFNSDDFNVSSGAVTLATTSTAAELNILDGATVTTAELNLLDGKAFLDEDDMASNSATGIASQQSIKAYVDTTVAATNEVVEDSTPQLGGNLDLNSNDITGTGNINITGSTTVDAGSYTTAITGNSITFNRNGDNNIVADSGSSANLNITVGNRITSSADSYHAFKTGSTPTERVRINSTGIDVTGSVTADGLTVNGNATITGADIDISSLIRHIGDTNTYIGFHGNDLFRVVTNDIERFEVSNNGVIINDTGVDADFRVESNSNAHALFVDAGNNRVSVGASSPAGLFHVYDSSAGEQFISSSNSALRFVSTGGANYIQSGTATSSSSAADLIFTNVGGTGETMRILSGGNITIGTVDSYLYSNASSGGTYIDAGLKFESSNKKLEFWTADAERMSIASDGAATFTGSVTANAGVVVDNITIDGNEIDVGSGDLTVDVAGDIILDADGGNLKFADGGTVKLDIYEYNSNLYIDNQVSDSDIIFQGVDGSTSISALTLDMSDGGTATFNSHIRLGDNKTASFGAGYDIEITSDGTSGTIGAPNGNLTLDVAGDIVLNADGGDWLLNDGAVTLGSLQNDGNNNLIVMSNTNDKDIKFLGIDNSNTITALTLDMSDAGTATFNNDINSNGNININGDYLNLTNAFRIRSVSGQTGQIGFNRDPAGGANLGESSLARFQINGPFSGSNYLDFQAYHSNGNYQGGMRLEAGALVTVPTTGAHAVFNENGVDADFRVESNGNTHALFVDGGNNRVGVLTSSPAAPLDIQFGDNSNILRGSYASGEDNFFLELDSKIVTSGVVGYQFHLTNNGTAYNNTLTLDRGNVGVGVESADAKLHVNGNFLAESSSTLNSTIQATGNNTRAIGNYKAHDGSGNDVNMVMGAFGDANRGEISTNTNHPLRFYVNNTPSKYLEIASTGQIFTSHGMVINEDSNDSDFRVESNNNTHMLFVDAGADNVNIGTSTDHGGVLNVETTGNNVNLVLACTDTDGNEGPILDFTRDAGNVPSDNDIMGRIRFRNDDTNLTMTNYAEITSVVADVSNGTEDGQLQFNIMDNGTLRNFAHMTGGSGIVFNEDSNDINFRVESNGNTHMLFVDGGSDHVNIGTSTDYGGTLNVNNSLYIAENDTPRIRLRNIGNSDTELGVNGLSAGLDTFYIAQYAGIAANEWDFRLTGATREFAFIRGGVVNEGGGDSDFRVESNVNANTIFVEGSSGVVNFGRGSSSINANGAYVLGGEFIASMPANTNTYLLRNTATTAYTFYVSSAGQIHAVQTSISSLSDERLKENIVDIDTGLAEVMALKPRKFDWKEGEGSNEKNVTGFVAQEVETVLPNLIGNFEHDDLPDAKSVKMGDMVPTLVKAIQEQQTLIEKLTARITELENS